jgi:hypothetical protein
LPWIMDLAHGRGVPIAEALRPTRLRNAHAEPDSPAHIPARPKRAGARMREFSSAQVQLGHGKDVADLGCWHVLTSHAARELSKIWRDSGPTISLALYGVFSRAAGSPRDRARNGASA